MSSEWVEKEPFRFRDWIRYCSNYILERLLSIHAQPQIIVIFVPTAIIIIHIVTKL